MSFIDVCRLGIVGLCIDIIKLTLQLTFHISQCHSVIIDLWLHFSIFRSRMIFLKILSWIHILQIFIIVRLVVIAFLASTCLHRVFIWIWVFVGLAAYLQLRVSNHLPGISLIFIRNLPIAFDEEFVILPFDLFDAIVAVLGGTGWMFLVMIGEIVSMWEGFGPERVGILIGGCFGVWGQMRLIVDNGHKFVILFNNKLYYICITKL